MSNLQDMIEHKLRNLRDTADYVQSCSTSHSGGSIYITYKPGTTETQMTQFREKISAQIPEAKNCPIIDKNVFLSRKQVSTDNLIGAR